MHDLIDVVLDTTRKLEPRTASITFMFRDVRALGHHFKAQATAIRASMANMERNSPQYQASINQAFAYEDAAFTCFHAKLMEGNGDV